MRIIIVFIPRVAILKKQNKKNGPYQNLNIHFHSFSFDENLAFVSNKFLLYVPSSMLHVSHEKEI